MKVVILSGSNYNIDDPLGGLQVRYGDIDSDTVIGDEIAISILHRDKGELIEVDGGVSLTKDNARLLRAAIDVFINDK